MDLATNRKAGFEYHIVETLEVGIVLQGTEVKSCRAHQVSLQEGFIAIEKNEAWLLNAHISTYEQGNINNHEPLRKRKLLLHKKEILRFSKAIEQKGMTLIPLSLYLSKGKIKAKIALCRGKDKGDKRESIKKRQDDIQIKRLVNKKI